MPEQRYDIRRVLWHLRRQRVLVAVCVLVGALIPAVLMFARPASYSATSLVIVPNSLGNASNGSNGAPSVNSNVTDSQIAVSSAVLGPAGARVSPHLSFQAVAKQVNATALASNLLQIKAAGPSPREAEALANAVANRLVAFLTSSEVSNGSSGLAGLQSQASELTKQVNQYDHEIQLLQAAIAGNGISAATAQQDTQLLGSLTTARATTSLQLESVNSQIADTKLNLAATNGGTQVIESATVATQSSLFVRLLPILIGAAIGLLVGGIVAMIRQRGSNLATRDEIAHVAGVPVVLSLAVREPKRSSKWQTLLREYEPTATEVWSVQKVLGQLDSSQRGRQVLTVITLANDSASVAAVAHVAVASATLGRPTSLVLTSDDPGSRGLSEACDLLTARHETARQNLRIFKGSLPVDENEGELTMISIVLNPEQPKLPAFVARGMVVVAVSAGCVSQEQLVRVLIAVGHEGLAVEGVFVVNPANSDETLGMLPRTGEQVTRLLQQRAVEPWSGGADAR
jgi:Chain length determinant protein